MAKFTKHGYIEKEKTKRLEKLLYNLSCDFCAVIPINKEIYEIFGKAVCSDCQYQKLKFTTKTTSLKYYLLTLEELNHFKYICRPNPFKNTWSDMNLYFTEEIENFSIKKFGSLEKLAEERKLRSKKFYDRKVDKLRKKIECLKKSTQLNVKRQNSHKHDFKNGKCECGMKIEEEEL